LYLDTCFSFARRKKRGGE
jgi:hypothetical protein